MTLIEGLIKCAGIDPVTLGVLGGSSLGAALAAKSMSKHISPFATADDIEEQRILHILAGAALGGGVGGLGGKSVKELVKLFKSKSKEGDAKAQELAAEEFLKENK